jgi:hypothetical protein
MLVDNHDSFDIPFPLIHSPSYLHQILNFARYSVAAAIASSIFPVSVPLPIATGALPPAFPPTTCETEAAQSAADAPPLAAVCTIVSVNYGRKKLGHLPN